jgi:hypothetical protein
MTRPSSSKSNKRTPPPPSQSPYTVVHQSPNSTNQSLARTVAEGAAFGVGSSVARHAVGNILATSPLSSTANISDDCKKYIRLYENCLSETTLTCQEYMDKIQIHCNDRK